MPCGVPRVRTDVYDELAGEGVLGVFVFAGEAYSEVAPLRPPACFHHRGFREDPATGSANTAFAAHLHALGVHGRIVVEQGFEIGRPLASVSRRRGNHPCRGKGAPGADRPLRFLNASFPPWCAEDPDTFDVLGSESTPVRNVIPNSQ